MLESTSIQHPINIGQQLLQSLRRLPKDVLIRDKDLVIFECGDDLQVRAAHCVVLKSRSPFFQRFLDKNFYLQRHIKLGISADVFDILLEYLYSFPSVRFQAKHAEELLAAAAQFDLPELEALVTVYLGQKLTAFIDDSQVNRVEGSLAEDVSESVSNEPIENVPSSVETVIPLPVTSNRLNAYCLAMSNKDAAGQRMIQKQDLQSGEILKTWGPLKVPSISLETALHVNDKLIFFSSSFKGIVIIDELTFETFQRIDMQLKDYFEGMTQFNNEIYCWTEKRIYTLKLNSGRFSLKKLANRCHLQTLRILSEENDKLNIVVKDIQGCIRLDTIQDGRIKSDRILAANSGDLFCISENRIYSTVKDGLFVMNEEQNINKISFNFEDMHGVIVNENFVYLLDRSYTKLFCFDMIINRVIKTLEAPQNFTFCPVMMSNF